MLTNRLRHRITFQAQEQQQDSETGEVFTTWVDVTLPDGVPRRRRSAHDDAGSPWRTMAPLGRAGRVGMTACPRPPSPRPAERGSSVVGDMTTSAGPTLQQRFAPASRCFGCGPANELGLRVGSHEGPDDELLADWMPGPEHEAFDGILNGGVIGTLLDCHCNWTAAYHLMRQGALDQVPATVTAEYHIRLLRPTPSAGPVHLEARVVESEGDRAVVEGTLAAGGKVTATCRGTFVAVAPGHPAYHRW